jgi:hypothetical protein
MHSAESQEQVARQLAGIGHMLEALAEEADEDLKSQIARAAKILDRVPGRCPMQCMPSSATTPAASGQISFDTSEVLTREFQVGQFSCVEIDCAFVFKIEAAPTWSVAVTANESLFDCIGVGKAGDTLKLSLKPLQFNYRPVLEARITMPSLTRLRQGAATKGMVLGFRTKQPLDLYLSGASTLDVDVSPGYFKAEVSGASRITGRLHADKAEMMLSGASRIALEGNCANLLLSAWGAVDAGLSDLQTREATVYLKGASQAIVNIADKLDVDLTGASTLRYLGNPNLNDITLVGASVLTHATVSQV